MKMCIPNSCAKNGDAMRTLQVVVNDVLFFIILPMRISILCIATKKVSL